LCGSLATVILALAALASLISPATALATEQTTVTVDAAAQTDDGASWPAQVPVTKGDHIKITATGSGYYCQEDQSRGGCPSGPDGGAGDTAAYGCNAGQLIGKFGGAGTVMCLGSSVTLTVPSTGALELGFDDWPNSHGQVNGVQSDTGSYSVTVEILSSKVSGFVYEVKCGDSSCRQAPLQGTRVLLTGQASDGAAVSQIATSGANGSWSVDVPAGSYDAGPTQDGANIDGKGFDPQGVTLTVGDADVPNVDFRTCALPPGSTGMAADLRAGRPAHDTAGHAAAASKQPSMCTAIYTMTVSAKLPGMINDPSLDARYLTGHGKNYNKSVSWRSKYIHSTTLRGLLHLSPEFPECLAPRLVKKYTNEGATAEWYSYIKGGPLGRVTLPVAWNQSTQSVHLIQAPTVVTKKLVRVFRYRIHLGPDRRGHDHYLKKQCASGPTAAQLLIWPETGGDGFAGAGGSNRFTLLVAWGFPFSPPGVAINAEGTAAEKVIRGSEKAGKKLFHYLHEKWEKLPKPAQFVLEFGAGVVLDTAVLKTLFGGASYAHAALKAAKLTDAATIARIEQFGSIAKVLAEGGHVVKASGEVAKAAAELADVLSGTAHYPWMSAVIRGKFTSSDYIPVATGVVTPAKTNLALSVSATKFPTISLTARRDAYQGPPETGKFARKPRYSGPLPWATNAIAGVPATAAVVTHNPFSANPSGQITNLDKNNHQYLIGRRAVQNLIADMSQNRAVTRSAQKYGSLARGFSAEQDDAPEPACDADGVAVGSTKTICWTFTDER
jgi:hypothetical protein